MLDPEAPPKKYGGIMSILWAQRVALADADTAPGGPSSAASPGGQDSGSDTVTPRAEGSESSTPDDKPTKVDPAIERELAAAKKRADELEAKEKSRADKERKAAEKKRLEEEGAAKVLKEREAELEAMRSRIEAMEKAQQQRAEAMLANLPEANREKLEKFKERMDSDAWAALVEAEAETVSSTPAEPEPKTPLPPPTGTPVSKGTRNGDSYTPTAKATKLLAGMLRDDSTLRELTLEPGTPDSGGNPKFTMCMKKFFDKIPRARPEEISFRRDRGDR